MQQLEESFQILEVLEQRHNGEISTDKCLRIDVATTKTYLSLVGVKAPSYGLHYLAQTFEILAHVANGLVPFLLQKLLNAFM